jgi:hypothetical protein
MGGGDGRWEMGDNSLEILKIGGRGKQPKLSPLPTPISQLTTFLVDRATADLNAIDRPIPLIMAHVSQIQQY